MVMMNICYVFIFTDHHILYISKPQKKVNSPRNFGVARLCATDFGERAKNGGVSGVLISLEIFCPRAASEARRKAAGRSDWIFSGISDKMSSNGIV